MENNGMVQEAQPSLFPEYRGTEHPQSRFPGKAEAEAAEAARRREHKRVEEEIASILACYAGDFARLHEVASGFFAAESAGKTYERRPNLSLRLAVEGEPPARLLIHPGWVPYHKELDTSRVELELMHEETTPEGKTKRRLELSVYLKTASGAKAGRYYLSQRGVDSAHRLAESVAAFLRNPAQEFARSAEWCCICGRALTDGVSRARGIGPECLRQASGFRRLVERLQAEPAGVVR
jgi:hypothetical protein